MFSSTSSGTKWFLRLAFILTLSTSSAYSSPDGIVTAALQWGSSIQSYTYIFSGLVTCHNHPCSNARVELALDTESQGAIVQSTRADEDGRYQIEVTLQGVPSNASAWKLEAHSPSISQQESAEAEGRLILTEGQLTVAVERALLLIQA